MKLSIQLGPLLAVSFFLAQFASAETGALSKHDQLKIAAQKICPVSGKPLGSMGSPPKVRVGEEEVFLCCQGCTKGQINKEHWATIHANFAKAQGQCPVMEKALPANPKWTVVKGQMVYICCPPCAKKIQADPDKFLAKVDSYYLASLKDASNKQGTPHAGQPHDGHSHAAANAQSPSSRDGLKVAVQKICPVSGKPLGSMGAPIKVNAGGMELYLCCEGCKEGQVSKEHWSTIRRNIAEAQGVCPVMEEELPANAKSTVVNGQIVFVCCPPCTKKIQKDPAKFLAKIDSYYMASLKQDSKSPAVLR